MCYICVYISVKHSIQHGQAINSHQNSTQSFRSSILQSILKHYWSMRWHTTRTKTTPLISLIRSRMPTHLTHTARSTKTTHTIIFHHITPHRYRILPMMSTCAPFHEFFHKCRLYVISTSHVCSCLTNENGS